jgi:hypothetical protein
MSCDGAGGGNSTDALGGDVSNAICSATQTDGFSYGGAFEFYLLDWLAFGLGVNFRSSEMSDSLPIGEYTIDDSSYSLDYDLLLKPRYTLRSSAMTNMGIEGLIFEAGAGVNIRKIYTSLTTQDGSKLGDGEINDSTIKYVAGVKLLMRSRFYAGLQYTSIPEISDYEVCISSNELDQCLDQEEVGFSNLPARSSYGLSLGYIF